MTAQELLTQALGAAAHTAEGVAELKAAVVLATDNLNSARRTVAEAVEVERQLAVQQAGINAELHHVTLEAQRDRPALIQGLLNTFSEPFEKRPEISPTLAKTIARQDADIRKRALLQEALTFVANEQAPQTTCQRTEAQIQLAIATRDWYLAAGYADLAALNLLLIPLLAHDSSLKVDCGPDSKCAVYASSLTLAELEIATLKDRLALERRLITQVKGVAQ